MGQPSNQLADRYRLQLPASWQRWFDDDSLRLNWPGAFRTPATVADLLESAPSSIWPGFMLPDTLPILGNEYGDWICVRVLESETPGELIHWYHGGGDWIPVGQQLVEAILHDTIDAFRPLRNQMIRGAAESLAPDHLRDSLERLTDPQFREWMNHGLAEIASPVHWEQIDLLLRPAENFSYGEVLQQLVDTGIANSALTCDLIEFVLHAYRQQTSPAILLPAEQWRYLESKCQPILAHRSDLGWATAVAATSRMEHGDWSSAAALLFAGRHASSFADQSVRVSKLSTGPYGKFSVSLLLENQDRLPDAMRSDSYLDLFATTPSNQRLEKVQGYWEELGQVAMSNGEYERAYYHFYNAGWDLGCNSLSAYRTILAAMSEAASQAGWSARAEVAKTHLKCLDQRL